MYYGIYDRRYYEHYPDDDIVGYICPFTGKEVYHVWSNHDLPGLFNSCEHCTGDHRTIGQKLHELNEARKNEEI